MGRISLKNKLIKFKKGLISVIMKDVKQKLYMARLIGVILFLGITACFAATVDSLQDNMQQMIKIRLVNSTNNWRINGAKILCSDKLTCGSKLTAQFYQENRFKPVWMVKGKLTTTAESLIQILNSAYVDGLNPRFYHVKQIEILSNALNLEGENKKPQHRIKLLTNLEMTLTDAFFLYASNLSEGFNNSKKIFVYWPHNKKSLDYVAILNEAITKDSLQESVSKLAPQYPMYAKLKAKLNAYQMVKNNGGWGVIPYGETLQRGDSGDRVLLLQRRLLISGELDKIDHKGEFDGATETAVMQYQQNNGLYDDGVVSKETLSALNVSVSQRVRQIELNLDKIRFLPRDMGDEYIIVNLPKYSLDVLKDNKVVLSMDVAVGDEKHPSCILVSKVAYLVLNPYWNIPRDIATTEMWPQIKDNPNIFKQSKLQVLKNVGKDDFRVVNPDKINWLNLSTKEFAEYKFRQEPGSENALGKVKFIFKNPCEIYLHDSNKLEVFDMYRRDFSHGCIRVSEPMNLANYILSTQKGWTEDEIITKLDSGQTKIINLPKPINIYIVYFTAWVNDDDWVEFRNDIYNLDKLTEYP